MPLILRKICEFWVNLPKRNTALLSTFRMSVRPSTGVTSHICPMYIGIYAIWIIRRPMKSYIFRYISRTHHSRLNQTRPYYQETTLITLITLSNMTNLTILTDQKNYQNINAESALFTLSCFLIVWGQEWWVRFVLILLSSTCNFLLYEVKSGGGERENIFWFLNEKKYMYMIQYNFFLILDFLIVWGQERWGKGNICFF